jgi:metal transporter CNNM
MEMKIKARSGTPDEKKYAAKLIPIIANHHLLLVTLMLWNASATEALPIFLSALVPEYVAIIISVTLVLFVGEIIPASILTGPNQLKITSALTPLVYFVLAIFFPIAYPISKGLDWTIGHSDGTLYNRTEITTMMRLHREEGLQRRSKDKHGGGGGGHGKHGGGGGGGAHGGKASAAAAGELYEEEEVTIIHGALKYREMTVSEVMTPAARVYMISVTEKLSYKTIYEIFKCGYSRIPVYGDNRHDIVGLILAKDMIFIDPEVSKRTYHGTSDVFFPNVVFLSLFLLE